LAEDSATPDIRSASSSDHSREGRKRSSFGSASSKPALRLLTNATPRSIEVDVLGVLSSKSIQGKKAIIGGAAAGRRGGSPVSGNDRLRTLSDATVNTGDPVFQNS
jgi:hypothetical protein